MPGYTLMGDLVDAQNHPLTNPEEAFRQDPSLTLNDPQKLYTPLEAPARITLPQAQSAYEQLKPDTWDASRIAKAILGFPVNLLSGIDQEVKGFFGLPTLHDYSDAYEKLYGPEAKGGDLSRLSTETAFPGERLWGSITGEDRAADRAGAMLSGLIQANRARRKSVLEEDKLLQGLGNTALGMVAKRQGIVKEGLYGLPQAAATLAGTEQGTATSRSNQVFTDLRERIMREKDERVQQFVAKIASAIQSHDKNAIFEAAGNDPDLLPKAIEITKNWELLPTAPYGQTPPEQHTEELNRLKIGRERVKEIIAARTAPGAKYTRSIIDLLQGKPSFESLQQDLPNLRAQLEAAIDQYKLTPDQAGLIAGGKKKLEDFLDQSEIDQLGAAPSAAPTPEPAPRPPGQAAAPPVGAPTNPTAREDDGQTTRPPHQEAADQDSAKDMALARQYHQDSWAKSYGNLGARNKVGESEAEHFQYFLNNTGPHGWAAVKRSMKQGK